jgi:hypothetical protein
VKALGGALVALAFFYAFYAGVMTVWSYIQIAGVVDKAWEDQGRHGASSMRAAVVRFANDAGVPLDTRFVLVGEDERTISVAVRWSFPVIKYKGEVFVEIPLSLQRSFDKLP